MSLDSIHKCDMQVTTVKPGTPLVSEVSIFQGENNIEVGTQSSVRINLVSLFRKSLRKCVMYTKSA